VNGKNTMAISYKYKLSGGSYGSAVQISNRTRYTISCDKENAYVFSITVADRLGSTTREFHLDKGKFPLFIDTQKNAVGINAFPESGEAMRVAGGFARFDDGIELFSNGVKEWLNPPMDDYVEYRTTRRYFGKPIYTRAFSMAALPNNTSVTVGHGIPNIDKPLSIRGYMDVTGSGNMVSVPYHDSTTNWVGMTLQRVNCTFATGASVGGFPVHVIVEYTKSTD
jgi:hypothetical protein